MEEFQIKSQNLGEKKNDNIFEQDVKFFKFLYLHGTRVFQKGISIKFIPFKESPWI